MKKIDADLKEIKRNANVILKKDGVLKTDQVEDMINEKLGLVTGKPEFTLPEPKELS